MAGARVGARAQLGQYVRRGQDRSSAGDLGPEISQRAGAQCADQHPHLEREFPATRTGPEERMPQIDDDAPFLRHRALARAKQIKVATEESKRIDKAASDGIEAPIVAIGDRDGPRGASRKGDRLLLWPEISSVAEFAAHDARIYPRFHLFALTMALPRSAR